MKHFGLTIGDGPYALASVTLTCVIAYLWFGDTGLTKPEKFSGTTVMVSALGIMFSFWQSERSRRKQFRVEFLTKAYQAIEEAFSRDFDKNSFYRSREEQWMFAFENAIRDLQLMGSLNVAGMAHSFTFDHKFNDRNKVLEDLLTALRKELREEIGEQYIPDFPRSLRHLNN